MSDNKIRVVAGLDIGNGYVKGKTEVNGKPMNIDMPSVVAYVSGTDLPVVPTDDYMNDVCNELDVTISSKVISGNDRGRCLFGRRAILSGKLLREFDIQDREPKCEDSLSTMLILENVAAVALRYVWEETGALPNGTLSVETVLGIALPINDYMAYREVYANKLMGCTHYLTVHNFDADIMCEISFAGVEVVAEGAAGQFAITTLGAPFLDAALDIAREQGCDIDPEYTGQVLVESVNTIGIDIGEGTTNFPVFTNGAVNIDASSSINYGYGTVLTEACDRLEHDGVEFKTRKDLADFMLQAGHRPAQRRILAKASHVIDTCATVFANSLMREYKKIFREVGMRTDVVYVYGGGANAMRELLYPMLIEASRFDDTPLPVIYLDSAYSRDLNRNGLFDVACARRDVLGWGERHDG